MMKNDQFIKIKGSNKNLFYEHIVFDYILQNNSSSMNYIETFQHENFTRIISNL